MVKSRQGNHKHRATDQNMLRGLENLHFHSLVICLPKLNFLLLEGLKPVAVHKQCVFGCVSSKVDCSKMCSNAHHSINLLHDIMMPDNGQWELILSRVQHWHSGAGSKETF